MSIVEPEILSLWYQKAVQVRAPQSPAWFHWQLSHDLPALVELPAKKSAGYGSRKRRIIGIVGKVLFYPHQRILHRLLFQVFFPGFLRSNLEDDMWSRPSLAHAPTSQVA